MKARLRQLQQFFVRYECVIVAFVSIGIVGFACFSFGLLKGAQLNKPPLQITTTEKNTVLCNDQCMALEIPTQTSDAAITPVTRDENCLFVGSVNGTKYYPPDCPSVNRISPQNLTCFTSQEDAESRGYARTTAC